MAKKKATNKRAQVEENASKQRAIELPECKIILEHLSVESK